MHYNCKNNNNSIAFILLKFHVITMFASTFLLLFAVVSWPAKFVLFTASLFLHKVGHMRLIFLAFKQLVGLWSLNQHLGSQWLTAIIGIKISAPGEARTHGLQIMRLTRCLLRYGGTLTVLATQHKPTCHCKQWRRKNCCQKWDLNPRPHTRTRILWCTPYQGSKD